MSASPSLQQDTPRADARLTDYILEMADLTVKRNALETVFNTLRDKYASHENVCTWLNCVDRAVASIDRRIEMIERYLVNGVL